MAVTSNEERYKRQDMKSGMGRISSATLAVVILASFAGLQPCCAQIHGPVFLMEPPSRMIFSNSSGAKVSCSAHGFPPPTINWQLSDGSAVATISGIREILENGTMLFQPFSPSKYRQDVHATVYRCRAVNQAGTVISRDMKVTAVIWQDYPVGVQTTQAIIGNAAILTCSVPVAVKEHVTVTSWYRDETIILPSSDDGGRHIVTENGWRLIVRNTKRSDTIARFCCVALDTSTGERKRSAPIQLDLSEPKGDIAPHTVSQLSNDVIVKSGSDIYINCPIQGNPPPIITWYRVSTGAYREVGTSGRVSAAHGVLAVRRTEQSDTGDWACRAHGPRGDHTHETTLRVNAHLTAHLQPQLQIVNSGNSATLNCTVGGSPTTRVEWYHNGVPIRQPTDGGRIRLTDSATLVIANVYRSDRGMYQCMVINDVESAQASAEIRLGDTAPELQYTFIEQALRAGPAVSLRCSATGSPSPHFTWMLDGQLLSGLSRGMRYNIDQFASKGGDIVTFLNISSVIPEDGGLYTCEAGNSLGKAVHNARLNVYGPPYVRSISPVRAVSGRELILHCPYSGYPISSVRWEHEGTEKGLENKGGPIADALHIKKVDASHAGSYSCTVTGSRGEVARRDVQVVVNNPPEIEPFSFPANLQEGKRAQVSCSVTSGDMPVYFTWYKDSSPIPASLQVEERGAEFFSNLVFKEVSSRHSGIYTCVASNTAAKVNFSTELNVKVPPKWMVEPENTSSLAGESVTLHCLTRGSPTPTITWYKEEVKSSKDFVLLINLGGRFHFVNNGTLWIENVGNYDEGLYMCKAHNDIGASISKTVLVSVNEPARFDTPSTNVTARKDTATTLTCNAYGDQPMQLTWTHNGNRVDLNTYRLSISEVKTDSGLRSQLFISRSERHDSGLYRCYAVNTFGHSEHIIYLLIQERPDPPYSLNAVEIGSRSVRLGWKQGFDGNAPLVAYTVQYISHQGLPVPELRLGNWENAIVHNISLLNTGLFGVQQITHNTVDHMDKSDDQYEAVLNVLKPHTEYSIRIQAINQITTSQFTESIVVKTLEEAPSGPPTSVQVNPAGPGELHVSWRPPPRDTWNGELLGYIVMWIELTTGGFISLENSTKSITVNNWSSGELMLNGLRKFTRYEIRLRAFNSISSGPPSPPITATTLEGVPEAAPMTVSCSPLSSSSLKVSWNPPPHGQHGGLIQGYKVIYTPQISHYEYNVGEVKRITTTETYVHTLHKYTNYSIQVLAFTNAGDGKRSDPTYCRTDEDVPSAPQMVKALAMTGDSVLVSWLPPVNPNGAIAHFTVYQRESGRIGKQSNYPVSIDDPNGSEFLYEVRNLAEHKLYEFWVSATTRSGEGDHTPIVTQSPNTRAPARIASFGQSIRRGMGATLKLHCATAGNPTPRSRWLHAGAPVTHAQHLRVSTKGDLHIHMVNSQTTGNFTCTASNLFGEDSITYSVVAILPPSAPILGLQYTTTTTAKVHWQPPKDGGSSIIGYLLSYKMETEKNWHVVELSSETLSYILENLKCGTTYSLKISAKNRIAIGPFGDIMTVSTRGSAPKAPKNNDLITRNSTSIKFNLFAWRDGGCTMLDLRANWRRAGESEWIPVPGKNGGEGSVVVSDLTPGQWYEVKVIGINDAGTTQALLHVDTLRLDGSRIPPPESPWPAVSGTGIVGGRRNDLLTIAAAVLAMAVIAVISLACFVKRKTGFKCLVGRHYSRDSRPLSDTISQEPEREKLRDGHKLYSSSSINGNDKSNESSEMYEISPYATFGGPIGGVVGGSASAVGRSSVASSMHFRTFAPLDDALTCAPPSMQHHRQHNRSKHHHQHHAPIQRCDTFEYDESTLSKAMTVEARTACRAALRAGGAGWGERPSSRPRDPRDPSTTTDEDDNSDSANTTAKGSRCASPLVAISSGSTGSASVGGYGSARLPRCSR